MVSGIGVDILEIDRMRTIAQARGDHFLRRVFTDPEIQYCRSKHNSFQHFAARFAAKEALSKAISTGWRNEFSWRDVEVVNEPSGQPRITLHGRLLERLATHIIHLSISHSEAHVVAMVVIERP